MTAPLAPRILARDDGVQVYVRWQPVPGATDYNLYFAEGLGAYGIEAQFDEADVEEDGWFFYISAPYAGIVNVKLTALNAGAEESSDSNIVQVNLSGGGETNPTSAVTHVRKNAYLPR